jgi:membrane protein implicated in regulation of membrane protease activity
LGVVGIAALAAGGWMIIGAVVIVLVVPVYLLFAVSVPVGITLVLIVAAWLIHRGSRPAAIARREQARRGRQIKRELERIPDDLPV